MFKKILYTMMATIVVLGIVVASIQPAEARRGRGWGVGIGLGILGLALLAAPRAYAYGPSCYAGPRQCARTGPRQCFYNDAGNYVCRGGKNRCWRPTYCD